MSAPQDDVAPRSSISRRGDAPVVMWGLAILALAAALISRAFEPALPGVWVGVDHIITAVKLGAALLSQLVAVVSAAVVVGLIVATVRSTLPAYLRAYAVGAGVLVVLAVMIASAVRLPHVSRLVVAGAAALLVLLCARFSVRIFTHRAAALILAAMAAAGLVRVLAIALSPLAVAGASPAVLAAVRSVVTLASATELAGLILALIWLVSQPGSGQVKLPRPRWILAGGLLLVAGGVLFVVVRGQDPEASGVSVLLARAVQELQTQPQPYGPAVVRGYLEIVNWLVVLAILIFNPRGRLMSASVALALVARSTLEIPLCAALLAIGALVLSLHPGPDLRVDGHDGVDPTRPEG